MRSPREIKTSLGHFSNQSLFREATEVGKSIEAEAENVAGKGAQQALASLEA
jgi:hypothetical protein